MFFLDSVVSGYFVVFVSVIFRRDVGFFVISICIYLFVVFS